MPVVMSRLQVQSRCSGHGRSTGGSQAVPVVQRGEGCVGQGGVVRVERLEAAQTQDRRVVKIDR